MKNNDLPNNSGKHNNEASKIDTNQGHIQGDKLHEDSSQIQGEPHKTYVHSKKAIVQNIYSQIFNYIGPK